MMMRMVMMTVRMDQGTDGDDLLITPMWVASKSMSATKNDQSEEEKTCLSV